MGSEAADQVAIRTDVRSQAIVNLASLLKYLWFYLVQRLGWRWWGIALLAAALPAVVWLARGRRKRDAGRYVAAGVLAAYLVVLLASTVLTRPPRKVADPSLGVLGKLLPAMREGHLGSESVVNALLLLPVGLLLPAATGWRLAPTLLTCLALTVGIETAQHLAARGWFELSDIALNMLGALVGYGIWALVRAIAERSRRPSPRHVRRAG